MNLEDAGNGSDLDGPPSDDEGADKAGPITEQNGLKRMLSKWNKIKLKRKSTVRQAVSQF